MRFCLSCGWPVLVIAADGRLTEPSKDTESRRGLLPAALGRHSCETWMPEPRPSCLLDVRGRREMRRLKL